MASRSRVPHLCQLATQLSLSCPIDVVLFAEGKVLLGCTFFLKSEKESPYGLYITLRSDEKVRIKHHLKTVLSHSHASSILSVRFDQVINSLLWPQETVRYKLSTGRPGKSRSSGQHLKGCSELAEACIGIPCGTKFLWEFIFVDEGFFGVLQERIFAIRTDWFFLLGTPGLGINFGDFQKVPHTSTYVQWKLIQKKVFGGNWIRERSCRAVNPRHLQILRIDRGRIINDVIMHETWPHLCKKNMPKRSCWNCNICNRLVYFPPNTLLLILQWHAGVSKETFNVKS